MAGFCGTEQQISLQVAADESRDWTKQTPGACDPGRFLGTDAPQLLGWDRIFNILARDGVFGFRMVPSDCAEEIEAQLQDRKFRIDYYDVFIATGVEANTAVTSNLEVGLPDDFRFGALQEGAEHRRTQMVQEFMSSNGIAPFSGSMLVGDDGPARTVFVLDQDQDIVAAAHAHFPHNIHSTFNRSAWGGLVSVSPTHRGKGLGTLVNSRLVSDCVSHLGAESIHELVAATNIPSRKMIEACGLRLDPTLKCGIAMAASEGQFTK